MSVQKGIISSMRWRKRGSAARLLVVQQQEPRKQALWWRGLLLVEQQQWQQRVWWWQWWQWQQECKEWGIRQQHHLQFQLSWMSIHQGQPVQWQWGLLQKEWWRWGRSILKQFLMGLMYWCRWWLQKEKLLNRFQFRLQFQLILKLFQLSFQMGLNHFQQILHQILMEQHLPPCLQQIPMLLKYHLVYLQLIQCQQMPLYQRQLEIPAHLYSHSPHFQKQLHYCLNLQSHPVQKAGPRSEGPVQAGLPKSTSKDGRAEYLYEGHYQDLTSYQAGQSDCCVCIVVSRFHHQLEAEEEGAGGRRARPQRLLLRCFSKCYWQAYSRSIHRQQAELGLREAVRR